MTVVMGCALCVVGVDKCFENMCTGLLTGGVAIGDHLTKGR